MYLDSSKTTINGQTYQWHLLCESYRENGKFKNRTIASLSHCSFAEIEAIRLALQHKHDLAWLAEHQERIERELFRRHQKNTP
ncbi:MAG: hypothetical protein HGB15_06340 [Chlorobaculum sp.]|nr:hypothetical protein [Chlorobaculum sp.]